MRNETVEGHFRKNYKKMVKRATYKVPNNSQALAEEVVQEAYTRALKFFKAFDPNRNEFSTWYNRILNSAIADCIRQENGHSNPSLDDEDEWLEPFVLGDDVDIPKEIVIKVQDAIKNNRDEEPLHLFFNLGMKPTDIAECTELSVSNVRQIIRRFRIKWEDENIF